MKRIKRNSLVTGLYALMLVGIVTGCDKDVYNPGNDDDGKLPPKENYFDFALKGDVQLNVNYDAPGYRAVIEVYDQYPMADYKTKKEGVSPVFVAYTDINGKYEGKMNIPTAVKEAYLYTSLFGLSTCVKLEASASGYTYDATKSTSGTRAAVAEGVLNDKVPFEVAVMTTTNKRSDNMYSLTTWNTNGIPTLDGYLTRPDKVGAANEAIGVVSTRVDNFLVAYNNDEANKVGSACGNAKLLRNPDQINLKIPAGGSTVSVSFMGEAAAFLNSFGYYYYPTGQTITPESFYKMKKYLVFPNSSGGDEQSTMTLKTGQTAKLLYFDKDGNQSEIFPEGYTIGWFLISNGFGGESFNAPYASGYVNQLDDFGYSNSSFYSGYRNACMSDDTGTDRRFISVYDEKSKMRIIGIEDYVKSSQAPDDYKDLLFAVTTSKDLGGGDLEPVPPVDPDPEPVVLPLKGTVAFEDIWPSGGDYDLNDVIVEYNRDITFDTNNKAIKAIETFKAVQPKGSAQNDNFFACQYKHLGKMKLPAGVIAETATNSFVIETSAKAIAEGTVYQIERDLTGLNLSQTDVANDFNPYIITKQYTTENRVEVHLPLADMTSAANSSLMTKDNAYYVAADGLYPFAINIPIIGFVPVTETKRIDLDGQYPSFGVWAKSKGEKNQDWYLQDKGKK